MIKNVSDPSIANVLSNDIDIVYTIPRYQREYTWGQRDWSNLYDDVFDNDSGYFLGSIIVIQGEMDPKTKITNYEVIDGQQRLTTISILLAALYSRINEYNDFIDEDTKSDEVRPLRNRLILKSDKSSTRVVPQIQNNNHDDYRWLLKERVGLQTAIDKPKNFGNRKISRAFKFFYDRLGEDVDSLNNADAVRELFSKLQLLCSAVLVQINVDSHADAYTLFAALNNRGVPLNALDLIKNTLLAKIAEDDESNLDYYFEQWQKVLRNLGEDYAIQERFFRQNYDAFRNDANEPFRQKGGAQFPLGSVATRSNLLKIYEKRIGDTNGAISVLEELIENSSIYSQIIDNNCKCQSNELRSQFIEISHAQGVPSYLMFLFLIKRKSRLELNDGCIAQIVGIVSKFFLRRNITDTPPTRDLERLFISICETIEKEDLKGQGVFEYVKTRLVDVSADETLFRNKLEGPIYSINPDMTRYILTKLAEPSVTNEMKDLWERNTSGNYVWTIEHVFPQSENIPDNWVKMIGEGDRSKAEEIQETHVHKLGNLTITGYNSKLGNMAFIDKRDRTDNNGTFVGYKNGLNLNEDLVNTNSWTKDQIDTRTDKLVEQALMIFSFENIDL